MNWTLVFRLSLFGLVMAVATVYVISPAIEPFFWLAIFVVCAVVIARAASGRLFVHGFLVSMLNSVWITAIHIALVDTYLARHPAEAAMMSSMPAPDSPRLMMLMMGPIIGAASGVVLGLLALLAGRFVKRDVRSV